MAATTTRFGIKQAVLNLQLINTEPSDSTTSLTEMVHRLCMDIIDSREITTTELVKDNLMTGGVVRGQKTGLDSMV